MKFASVPGVSGGVLWGALLLAGCASHSVEDRIALAEKIANENNFSKVEIKTDRFDLVSFVGPQKHRGVLYVYIEGDGFAWVTRSRPSRNPTPIDPIALKLAVLDGQDAVYLARPCQYAYKRGCQQRYWTSGRFSPDVIDAMDDAITRLKQDSGAAQLVLIGYSGGGTIAALVAARRTDVIHLITVAGNLDHVAWARLHAIPELRGSSNPPDYWRALAGIRQTHFVGEIDPVIPIDVYRSYRQAFPGDANIRVNVVPQADHGCCWERVWPRVLDDVR